MSRSYLAHLRDEFGYALHHHHRLDSTSDEALRLLRKGSVAPLLVLADQQFAGRGRRGTSWFCDPAGGLAFSLAMVPALPKVLWPRLALVAGLAVVRVLERRRFTTGLKWPNDIVIGRRKVAGILAEVEGAAVVLGIGVNCTVFDMPSELSAVATSLAAEPGDLPTREELLLEIVEELHTLMGMAGGHFEHLIQMARERCALTGEQIAYQLAGQEHRGLCHGIGNGGELLVRDGTTTHRLIAAEQIRII